ncbi:MAG TPA: hypothetical protein PK177_16950 [Burkholderiaceae bacterium]|nr:hypothetical protein [Burkholderiaceae bacterium]
MSFIRRNVLRELDKALRIKLELPATRLSELVEFVAGEAIAVLEEAQPVEAKVDADDALVLGKACSGHAEVFVTGDAALLAPARLPFPVRSWPHLDRCAKFDYNYCHMAVHERV